MADQIANLSGDGAKAAADSIASVIEAAGPSKSIELMDKLQPLADDKASKLGYCYAFEAISAKCGAAAEPYLVGYLPKLIDLLEDKQKPVQEAADSALTVFVSGSNKEYIRSLLPILFTGMVSTRKWQAKLSCVKQLQAMFRTYKKEMARALPEIIPPLCEVMWDTRLEVQNLSKETMTEICNVVANKDLDPFIPVLVSALAKPSEVPECVHSLSSTTFVQTVDAPTLSVMCPILIRGLRERSTPIKRKAALIIDNMSKLVENPEDVAPFLPKLLPELEIVKENVSDPECRTVANKAYDTLKQVGGEGAEALTARKAESDTVVNGLKEIISSKAGGKKVDEPTLSFVVAMACQLIDVRIFEEDTWVELLKPYFAAFMSDAENKAVAVEFKERSFKEAQEKVSCRSSLGFQSPDTFYINLATQTTYRKSLQTPLISLTTRFCIPKRPGLLISHTHTHTHTHTQGARMYTLTNTQNISPFSSRQAPGDLFLLVTCTGSDNGQWEFVIILEN
jgi:elongation factor 3